MSEQRLRPARFDPGDEQAFRPRFPWARAIALLLVVVGGGGFYLYRQQQKREVLRRAIAQTYASRVEPARERILALRRRLDGYVREAAGREPTRWADPKLRLEGLHEASGIYLRLPASAVGRDETLREAVRAATPDAIARCLGLSPLSARPLYERGRFLEPEWLQEVAETPSLMRLRVLDEEIRRFARRDLPILMELAGSDYFLLVLERGANRRDAPVDVFLWDLKRERLLLAVRARAERGLLVPVRLDGAPRGAPRPRLGIGGQVDCSIAAQVREAAGGGAPALGERAAERLQEGDRPAGSAPPGGTPAVDGGAERAASKPPPVAGGTGAVPAGPAEGKKKE